MDNNKELDGWWPGGSLFGWLAPKITHIQRVPMTMTSTADKPTEWRTEWPKEGVWLG